MTRAALACLACALVLSAALVWMRRRGKFATDSVLFVAAQRALIELYYLRALALIAGLCLLATRRAWMIGGVL